MGKGKTEALFGEVMRRLGVRAEEMVLWGISVARAEGIVTVLFNGRGGGGVRRWIVYGSGGSWWDVGGMTS